MVFAELQVGTKMFRNELLSWHFLAYISCDEFSALKRSRFFREIFNAINYSYP